MCPWFFKVKFSSPQNETINQISSVREIKEIKYLHTIFLWLKVLYLFYSIIYSNVAVCYKEHQKGKKKEYQETQGEKEFNIKELRFIPSWF